MLDLHKAKIENLSMKSGRVFLDGFEIKGLQSVNIDSPMNGATILTLEIAVWSVNEPDLSVAKESDG